MIYELFTSSVAFLTVCVSTNEPLKYVVTSKLNASLSLVATVTLIKLPSSPSNTAVPNLDVALIPSPLPYKVPITANKSAYVVRDNVAPLHNKNPSGTLSPAMVNTAPVGTLDILLSKSTRYALVTGL